MSETEKAREWVAQCRTNGDALGTTLSDLLVLDAEIDRLARELREAKEWRLSHEEREAVCCPEDVGFPEYVAALKAEVARALTALWRLQQERDGLRQRAEQAEAAIEALFARIDAGTAHRIVCNGNHDEPIGGDGCTCNPHRAELAKLRALAVEARAEGPYDKYEPCNTIALGICERLAALAPKEASDE